MACVSGINYFESDAKGSFKTLNSKHFIHFRQTCVGQPRYLPKEKTAVF